MDGNIFVLVPVCFRVTFRIGSGTNHALLQNGVHLALMSSSVIFSVAALLSGTCRREHPPEKELSWIAPERITLQARKGRHCCQCRSMCCHMAHCAGKGSHGARGVFLRSKSETGRLHLDRLDFSRLNFSRPTAGVHGRLAGWRTHWHPTQSHGAAPAYGVRRRMPAYASVAMAYTSGFGIWRIHLRVPTAYPAYPSVYIGTKPRTVHDGVRRGVCIGVRRGVQWVECTGG